MKGDAQCFIHSFIFILVLISLCASDSATTECSYCRYNVTILMIGSPETFASPIGSLGVQSTLAYARKHGYKVAKHVRCEMSIMRNDVITRHAHISVCVPTLQYLGSG